MTAGAGWDFGGGNGILERGGRVRAKAMPRVNAKLVEQTIADNVNLDNARLMTDEHPVYYWIKKYLPHDVIRHKSEYVRGPIHTNGIESFWAILKRGLVGTYHHVDAGYLNQYVNEFTFRHNSRQGTDAMVMP